MKKQIENVGKKLIQFLIKSKKHKKLNIKSKKQKILVAVSALLVLMKFILLFGFFVYLVLWIKKK